MKDEKKSSEEQGQFNLTFEETVLLRSRLSNMKGAFAKISRLASRILGREDYLSENDKADLLSIKETADNAKKDI